MSELQSHDISIYGRSPVQEPRLFSGRRPLFSWVSDGRMVHTLVPKDPLGQSQLAVKRQPVTLDEFLASGGAPLSAERTPYLAYALNAAPGTHKHKNLAYVPMIESSLHGLEICFTNLKLHGYLTHTLARRDPKHPRFLFIALLAPGDWAKLLQHEQVGENARLVRLREGYIQLKNGRWLDHAYTILPKEQAGILLDESGPVPSHKYTQEQLWGRYEGLKSSPCGQWVSASAVGTSPPPQERVADLLLADKPTYAELADPHL